jgi:hypothetical protein
MYMIVDHYSYLIGRWRWRLGGCGLGISHLSTLIGDGAKPASLFGGMVAMVTKQTTLWIQNVLKVVKNAIVLYLM